MFPISMYFFPPSFYYKNVCHDLNKKTLTRKYLQYALKDVASSTKGGGVIFIPRGPETL